MTVGRKLALGVLVVVGATAYMAYFGAASSWRYYMTVDECLAGPAELTAERIRVSGKVAEGSLRIAPGRNQVDFSLKGTTGELRVVFRGMPPDNLVEGANVVAEGRLREHDLLSADKVLTRCASKYQSKESPGASGPTMDSAGKPD
ncbi:MAG: cytochrome c maturation protein CcmE [Planctomycetota bacterium]|jgi:cytochrome c-type biogenesis protein CcmE